MDRRYVNLIIILVLVAAVLWIDLSSVIKIGSFERSIKPVLGLDLRGGLQVLLKPPAGTEFDNQALEDAAKILENRANGLGVSEVVFQTAGGQYILGEFPGLTNTEEVISVLRQTGQLEFVDLGDYFLPAGTKVSSMDCSTQPRPELKLKEDGSLAEPPAGEAYGPFCTVMTGKDLKTVNVGTDQKGQINVNFTLDEAGTKVFADYTSANVGKFLAIVLDGTVISAPTISTAITKGEGQISGNFTIDEANNLAITLRYGRLPVALEVVESRVIGPTLGADSLNKSLLAGVIGFIIVALFMIIYYRLPGVVAVIAIAIYAGITFALFKLIPVTLTLPGIAGFLLSTGSALDANILIFERLKEELRNGRSMTQAIELGFKRAWSSIRDSNIATIITSLILFWFGSAYGATIVKGFALTLAIGVVVSVFTAVFVSRNLLTIAVDFVKNAKKEFWFGI